MNSLSLTAGQANELVPFFISIAIVLSLVAMLYFRKRLIRDDIPSLFSDWISGFSIIVFLFIVATAFFISLAWKWITTNHQNLFFSGISDNNLNTLLHQSRSLLAVGVTISAATLTFFLPKVLELWNESARSLECQIREIAKIVANPASVYPGANKVKSDAINVYRQIESTSKILRPIFNITILICILEIFAIVWILFLIDIKISFLAGICFTGFAAIILLWMLSLFAFYILFVQRHGRDIERAYTRLFIDIP
jgi:ABC-type multidrug transport system fused ATPase/permease subunit